MRIGHGYDVHRLVPERELILGGVKIPFERGLGLLGHSDADVLIHAVMDALIGAAALGDIGRLFPDTAPEYSGADSLVLLLKVADMLCRSGFSVVNIDATIIVQSPKLAPYIDTMRENIAQVLKTEIYNINIKATTEENLGFTGDGSAIAAHAVCLII